MKETWILGWGPVWQPIACNEYNGTEKTQNESKLDEITVYKKQNDPNKTCITNKVGFRTID